METENDFEKILATLKAHTFFAEISEEVLLEILNQSQIFCLKKGEIVFRQGDDSTDLYFNVSGFLLPILKKPQAKLTYFSEIKEGEIFGEMGILTGHKRSLTIQANTNVVLVKINKSIFDDLLFTNPSAYKYIILSLINRSQNNLDYISGKENSNKHYILIPTENNEKIDQFISSLKKMLSNNITEKMLFLNPADLIKLLKDTSLKAIEEQYKVIIYYFDTMLENIHLLHDLINRASGVLSIGSGNQNVYFSRFHEKIFSQPEVKLVSRELILLWNKGDVIKGTKKWLTHHQYSLHHHIQDESDIKRLVRYFKGKSIGVVLGGGGARGWFHFGVLKALQEKNIPIDAIGGTSSGSGVASCYLLTNGDIDKAINMIETVINSFKHTLKWYNLTYPNVSIYDNAARVKGFKKAYSAHKIENLAVPFFALASNVSTNKEKVYTQGDIWKAILASSAIPVIFPPVPDEDGLLYDGGLMNNLPVDAMLKYLKNNATIIASDLSIVDEDYSHYYFPHSLTLKKLFLSKFKKTHKYKFPPFVHTVMKALLVGSIEKYYANVKIADCYIQSRKFNKEMFIFDKKFGLEVFNYGYQVAMEKLKKWNPTLECFD